MWTWWIYLTLEQSSARAVTGTRARKQADHRHAVLDDQCLSGWLHWSVWSANRAVKQNEDTGSEWSTAHVCILLSPVVSLWFEWSVCGGQRSITLINGLTNQHKSLLTMIIHLSSVRNYRGLDQHYLTASHIQIPTTWNSMQTFVNTHFFPPHFNSRCDCWYIFRNPTSTILLISFICRRKHTNLALREVISLE